MFVSTPPYSNVVDALIIGADIVPVAVIFTAVAVPVKAGDANGANKCNAVCVADDIGLLESEVLLTLHNPTIEAVMPDTVPVNVRLAFGAYVDAAVDVVRCEPRVVAKLVEYT